MKVLTKMRRWTAIGWLVALASLVAFTFISAVFSSFSVCDRCGAVRRTADWQLPFTEFTIFSRSTETDTPLSRVLLSNGMVPPHTHHWLFGHGGGNGVRCAIGNGGQIRSAAESDEVAALVLSLHQHGQIAVRDRVLLGVFDPETSRLFRGWSIIANTATMSSTEMQNWIAEQSDFLDTMDDAYKER